jgi:hypothetical protein
MLLPMISSVMTATVSAQLQVIVLAGLRWQAAFGQHQVEGSHAGEMHADDARPEHQAALYLKQLMQHARAVAQVPRQQQGRQRGADRDCDGKGKQPRVVIDRSTGVHGRHAHVMHGRDAQADPDGGLAPLPEAQVRTTEGMHRQPSGEQGESARTG